MARILGVVALAVATASCGGDDGAAAPVDEDREYTEAEKTAFQNFVENGHLFSDGARLCAARAIVFGVGAERLDQIVTERTTTEDEAEIIYDAFGGCVARNMVVLSAQSAVPGLTAEQSECFVDAAPTEDDTEDLVLESIRTGEVPELPQSLVDDVLEALGGCITDEQRAAIGLDE
jgi:hypothetical protein